MVFIVPLYPSIKKFLTRSNASSRVSITPQPGGMPEFKGRFTPQWRRYTLTLSLLLVLLLAQSSHAFWSYLTGHHTMTRTVLRRLNFNVGGENRGFADKAIEEVVEANVGVDESAYAPVEHFDNELIPEGSQLLIRLKDEVKTLARARKGKEARAKLGRALHTLQDFYAHSNWAELFVQGVVSGYDQRLGRSVITTGGGGGLPAVVRFTDAGHPGDRTALPLFFGFTDQRYFDLNLRKLATGYYLGTPAGCYAPPGKVTHGDLVQGLCAGVAKDAPYVMLHGVAFNAAVAATDDYVRLIVTELGTDTRAIKALLGVNGTLGVVVDTTGSMSEDIFQVVTQIHSAVASLRDTDEEPGQYLLEWFNDPEVGTPFVTTEPDAFLAAVNTLSASGGGDCPEYANSGILRAIAAADEEANLFVFTDADAKDSRLSPVVAAAAAAKRIRVSYALTGSCGGGFAAALHLQAPHSHAVVQALSAYDPSYLEVAAATGGIVLPVTRFQVGLIFDLVRPALRGDLATILQVESLLPRVGSESIPIPVDTTITRLTVAVTAPGATRVALLRPSGVAAQSGDPGVQITSLIKGVVFTIDAPTVGEWRLELSGTGSYAVSAQGNTPLQFSKYEFVREAEIGESHDGGLIRLAGQPLRGQPAKGRAYVIGPRNSAHFALVNGSGATLQTLDLQQNNPRADPEAFVGTMSLPSGPFRVAVTGIDARDAAYRRLFPHIYEAQLVGVAIASGGAANIIAGSTAQVEFTVTNFGPAATFNIVTGTNVGTATPTPTSLTLALSESRPVTVQVAIPANVPSGTKVSLSFAVSNAADPSIGNSAAHELLVVARTPPIPPTGLQVTQVTANSVALTWLDQSTGGADEEDGFDLERESANLGWVLVRQVGRNVASVTDTALGSNTTYRYRVRSRNAAGVSAPSNVATATTLLAIPSGRAVKIIGSGQLPLSEGSRASGSQSKVAFSLNAGNVGGAVTGELTLSRVTGTGISGRSVRLEALGFETLADGGRRVVISGTFRTDRFGVVFFQAEAVDGVSRNDQGDRFVVNLHTPGGVLTLGGDLNQRPTQQPVAIGVISIR